MWLLIWAVAIATSAEPSHEDVPPDQGVAGEEHGHTELCQHQIDQQWYQRVGAGVEGGGMIAGDKGVLGISGAYWFSRDLSIQLGYSGAFETNGSRYYRWGQSNATGVETTDVQSHGAIVARWSPYHTVAFGATKLPMVVSPFGFAGIGIVGTYDSESNEYSYGYYGTYYGDTGDYSTTYSDPDSYGSGYSESGYYEGTYGGYYGEYREDDWQLIWQQHATMELGFGVNIELIPQLALDLELRHVGFVEHYADGRRYNHRLLAQARVHVRIQPDWSIFQVY